MRALVSKAVLLWPIGIHDLCHVGRTPFSSWSVQQIENVAEYFTIIGISVTFYRMQYLILINLINAHLPNVSIIIADIGLVENSP